MHAGCEHNGLDVEGEPDAHNDESENKNNNDHELDCEDLGPTVFDTLTNPVYDAEDAPCLSEVLAIMFAWMGRHKATDACPAQRMCGACLGC